jgi:hypothetical protein
MRAENGGSQLWVVRTVHHTDINDPDSATAIRGAWSGTGHLYIESDVIDPPASA